MSDTAGVPSASMLEVADLPAAELVRRMRRGRRPDPAVLTGWEYLGLNTAPWLRAAGADRFVKGFAGGHGYNRRVRRGARTTPWLATGAPEPEPYAFYRISPVDPTATDNRYLHALLLDYGPYATARLDPAGPLRDYLVAVDDSSDLLLGHAFVAVGRLRLPATFFVLERFRRGPVPVQAPTSQ
ncbi:MAG: hypothetical protein ACR2K0_06940 [Acidimicrobiales bacterium]